MVSQDKLRELVRMAKALNEDWTFKMMSEVIMVTPNTFYNWLDSSFQLSNEKANQLYELVSDLIA